MASSLDPGYRAGRAALRRARDDALVGHGSGTSPVRRPPLADAPPLVWALQVGWFVVSFTGGQVLSLLVREGSSVRDCHWWEHEQAEREWMACRDKEAYERGNADCMTATPTAITSTT